MNRALVVPIAIMAAIGASITRAQPLVQCCHAGSPEVWVCPYEAANKWTTIDVESWPSSCLPDCAPCTVTSKITLDGPRQPGFGPARQQINENTGAAAGTLTPTGDTSTVSPAGGGCTFSEKLTIQCGESVIHDASYANCPVTNPDGPGPCTIAAVTYCCNACQ